MCFVNSQNVRDLRQPFGGTKASGTGREGGTWSYEVFLEPKNVCGVARFASHPALGSPGMKRVARQRLSPFGPLRTFRLRLLVVASGGPEGGIAAEA